MYCEQLNLCINETIDDTIEFLRTSDVHIRSSVVGDRGGQPPIIWRVFCG